MRVMTLNLWNYERGWDRRRPAIAQVIRDVEPDFLALQESRHDFRYHGGTGQAEQIAEITGYSATSAVAQVYLPFGKADEGLAILSRMQPDGSDVCPLTLHPHLREDENHRICLAVSFPLNGKRLVVAVTHFSLSGEARISNARETAAFLDRVAAVDPVVLMGDLNAEPDSPEIRFLAEEAGFRDLWMAARETDSGFTYASFGPVRRIDYILSKNLSVRSVAAHLVGTTAIDGVYPSDHLGVVADLSDV